MKKIRSGIADVTMINVDGSSAYSNRITTVMTAAAKAGLLEGRQRRIGARINTKLVDEAKAQTGIGSDTDLIRYALACLALEDRFAEAFKAVRGSVDPDLDLGF